MKAGIVTGSISRPNTAPNKDSITPGTQERLEALIAENEARVIAKCQSSSDNRSPAMRELEQQRCRVLIADRNMQQSEVGQVKH